MISLEISARKIGYFNGILITISHMLIGWIDNINWMNGFHTYPMTDPNGAAIYGAPWIPSTKTPVMLAYIPAPWIRHGLYYHYIPSYTIILPLYTSKSTIILYYHILYTIIYHWVLFNLCWRKKKRISSNADLLGEVTRSHADPPL